MNLAQRIVAICYCLLVCYCLAWIPWHSTEVFVDDDKDQGLQKTTVMDSKVGYAWVWSRGPERPFLTHDEDTKANGLSDQAISQVNAEIAKQKNSTTPDLLIIGLRVLAATALSIAMFLLAGLIGRRQSLTSPGVG